MRYTRVVVFFLTIVIPLTTYAQRSPRPQVRPRTLEGVVVDTPEGLRWQAIEIEASGKRYFVMTDPDPVLHKPYPKIVGGNVRTLGTRVRVIYTGMSPRNNDVPVLNAIRVIRLNDQKLAPRVSSQQDRLVGALSRDVNNPGCYYYFANRKLMFYDSDVKLMNVDGRDERLNLVTQTYPKKWKIGGVIAKRYSAGDITVDMVAVITKSSGISHVTATFTVRKGTRTQVVRATGACGG